jgi:SAM-dependent methyltransferase
MPVSLFDNDPANYDRARPQYPSELFDELVEYIGVRTGGIDAVEIGPGTGQATSELLTRGMRVTAVELGVKMAAFLRQKFAGETRLNVVNGAFEEVALDVGSADLVIAATAWHWLDRQRRVERAHNSLRRIGVLAVIDTVQVRDPIDNGFFERTFHIYQRFRPDEKRDPGNDVETFEHPDLGELSDSGLFSDVRTWRYRWNQQYDAVSYEALLRSYSDMARMEPEAREGLIEALIEVVRAEPEGIVTRPLMMSLVVGRRADT